MHDRWQSLAFGPETEAPLWELFHENSKIDRSSVSLSDEQAQKFVSRFHQSLLCDGYPTVRLPKHRTPLHMPAEQMMKSRKSGRDMSPRPITMDHLATLLYWGYGVTRSKPSTASARCFRTVPSAGPFYPLEIFVQAQNVRSLHPGLYHYNPLKHHLRLLRDGSHADEVGRCFMPGTIPEHVALLIFITALFRRSTFKYGERGYRFVLLEAGHAAQNINLAAAASKLSCFNIGGFIDRETDAFLHLDGIGHSAIYVIAVGRTK